MITEQAYRQRLEADLARWQADGVISAASANAIRGRLQPVGEGVTIATVVAIVGGLLIAAAFLAFIAANWTAIARPTRFAILLAGIAGAYLVGALFDRTGRTVLADLSVAVGAIIFGAAIALTGQMYHLADDFSAGLLLWAGGSLIAAMLTGSRGALAVALAAGCTWSGARVFELSDVHLPFVAFWLLAALLSLTWTSYVARHLAAVAAVAWWILSAIAVEQARSADVIFVFAVGSSVLLGGGLLCASRGADALGAFGLTLSTYGALALAIAVALVVPSFFGASRWSATPVWIMAAGGVGSALAFVAALASRRAGPAFAGLSIICALAVASGWVRPIEGEPWTVFALALASMLCLVVSGMLDDVRPRVVAGWIGLAAAIAAITWAVKGSLLGRAAFLAAAGVVAVGLASVLGRVLRKEQRR